jgi:hypothetical protein
MPSTPQVVPTVQVFDYEFPPGDPSLTNAPALSNVTVKISLDYGKATAISPVVNLDGRQVEVVTDANGYWQANLVPNTNINPANTTYTVRTPYRSYQISVPAGPGPYQVSSILISTPVALMPAGPYTAGGLFFGGAAGAVAQDAPQLFWDDTSHKLVVGGGSVIGGEPAGSLELRAAGAALFMTDGTIAKWLRIAGGNFQVNNSAFTLALFQVTEAGHLLSGGAPPTLGALQTGVSSQLISGTDSRMIITVTTAATPPGINAALVVVTFATPYLVTPAAVVNWISVAGATAAVGAPFLSSVGVSGFTLNLGQPQASVTYIASVVILG